MKTITSLFVLATFLPSVYAQSFSDIGTLQGINALGFSSDFLGSGLSAYDFNQDGWDDLSFVYENEIPKIYLNNQGTFNLIPFSFFSAGENKHLLWVDYDNDYDLDIFITRNNGRNVLLENDGNFQFNEVTVSAGLSTASATNYGASFGDYDLDGDLDLYVCKYIVQGDSSNLAYQNNLYQNNGDGTFTDVTFIAGFDNILAPSFQSVWIDYNRDGYPDLYVINDKVSWTNKLYENNGDGTFSNVTTVETEMPGSDPMSISVGDYDNDQDLDFFVSDGGVVGNPRGSLFTQGANLEYLDDAASRGILIETGMWGSTWLDYNNNGFLDLFVATEGTPHQKSMFYMNDSSAMFTLDTTIFTGSINSNSYACGRGDFNGDGYSDIAVVNIGVPNNSIWMNSGGINNYIKITLQGTVSNSMAIGSWIKVFVGDKVYTKYTLCGENYLGQDSQHQLFGLAQETIVDSVYILYPSGIEDKYYNLGVNQGFIFTEGETTLPFDLVIEGSNPFCQGDSVTLRAPDMLEYSWNTGDTTQSITVYSEGFYELSAIDSNGLTQESNEYHLEQIQLPSISGIVNPVSCDNFTDGEINLFVNNEGQAYEIEWSNGVVGDSLFGQTAGMYTYTYTDIYTCTLEDSLEIESPLPLNIQLVVEDQTWTQSGSIQALVNGGVAPYSIFLDSMEIGTELSIVDTGNYQLTVIDNNDCMLSEQINVAFQDTTISTGIYILGDNRLFVSPNPFRDEIRVVFLSAFSGDLYWELQDLNGKLILTGKDIIPGTLSLSSYKIPVPQSLPASMYYLKIAFDGEIAQFKLMKF